MKNFVRMVMLSTVLLTLAVGSVSAQMGSFKDNRDGKTYQSVKIGKQTWMAENLNYQTASSKCYGNDNSNCEKYGRLYDWNTAMTVCPAGWHLPSRGQWSLLVDDVGESWAGKLKSTSGWIENKNGTDDYGFSAFPSGWRTSNGSFVETGINAFWWTSTDMTGGGAKAFRRGIVTRTHPSEDYSSKIESFSVRCVAN